MLRLAATTSPADNAVVDAFARLVFARVEHHDGLLFEDFRDERDDPLADPALRRAVAAAVLAADPTDRVLHRLSGHSSYSLAVVRADDLAWLAELYVEAGGDMRNALRSLFRWTFDVDAPEHRDLVLEMPYGHPLHVDLVHAWVDPVALDSPEADEMRRSWEMFEAPKPAKAGEDDDINERIEERLARFDIGEAVGFWQSTRLLTVAPGSKHFGAEFDPDVVGMPRWPTLSEGLRERLVDAADRYLRSHPCQPQQWLHNPEIRYFPAEAGYRAMVLLLRVAPERLQRLPAAAWIEWAPVLASWSTASVNGATWDDKVQMLELAGPEARDVARAALLTRVNAAVSAGKRPFASNEASYLWDATVAATYLSLARSPEAEPREEIVTSLGRHDFDLLRTLLLEWLDDPSDLDRHRLAAETLIDRDLERSWPAVKAALDADLTLAEQVLGQALTVRGYEGIDHVPPAVLADIYLWLRARFPPESDPQFDDAHVVGPREQIGQWRDKLLGLLRDEGSPEAVDAVRAIVAALPTDRWLARTRATAEAALRRNQWTPTLLPQLLRLAADRRTVLVNDVAALAAAVASAMKEVQTRLTGATPESHYLWDTHAGRPKSEDEISDYLANELNRVLTVRGAIVNREVQIRRNRPSGIGERTDLLVDAAPVGGPHTGHLSLPVEVKGAWNDELRTAMRYQLVERYMRDTAATTASTWSCGPTCRAGRTATTPGGRCWPHSTAKPSRRNSPHRHPGWRRPGRGCASCTSALTTADPAEAVPVSRRREQRAGRSYNAHPHGPPHLVASPLLGDEVSACRTRGGVASAAPPTAVTRPFRPSRSERATTRTSACASLPRGVPPLPDEVGLIRHAWAGSCPPGPAGSTADLAHAHRSK